MVLSDDGVEIHPDVLNGKTGRPLRFKPENEELRSSALQVRYDPGAPALFSCENVPLRPVPKYSKAFESAWQDFREGRIFED